MINDVKSLLNVFVADKLNVFVADKLNVCVADKLNVLYKNSNINKK